MAKFIIGFIAGVAACVLFVIIRIAVENWEERMSDKHQYIDQDD